MRSGTLSVAGVRTSCGSVVVGVGAGAPVAGVGAGGAFETGAGACGPGPWQRIRSKRSKSAMMMSTATMRMLRRRAFSAMAPSFFRPLLSSEKRLLVLHIPGPGAQLSQFFHELPGAVELQVLAGKTDVGDFIHVPQAHHHA